MAGDWIKMRADLGVDPDVVRIACGRLSASCPRDVRRLVVVGALHAFWSWVDGQTDDGELGWVPVAFVEEITFEGFVESMMEVGWIERVPIEDGRFSLRIANFERHMGTTAKRRAMEAERKRRARNGRTESGHVSASDADELRTREEKRREEHSPPFPPPLELVEFWTDLWRETRGSVYRVQRRDGVTASAVLELADGDLDEAKRRAERLLRSQDEFHRSAASLEILRRQWNQLGVLTRDERHSEILRSFEGHDAANDDDTTD